MAHWRSLDAYTPFGRALVEYMWSQRPPLLPAQFAARMGVRKQTLSSWLSSDATPPPQVVVRLARAMGLPVADLLIAAGHAVADDPLFDTAGAWALLLDVARRAEDTAAGVDRAAEPPVEAGEGGERQEADQQQRSPSPIPPELPTPPVDQQILEQVLAWLQTVGEAMPRRTA